MPRPVAVVGAGSIGVAFAVHFATAGFSVRMWDALPDAPARALRDLDERLRMLHRHGLLAEPVEVVRARVSVHEILLDALAEAHLVQECAPERLDLKREIFQQLGAYSRPDAVLASSSSAIVASEFATSTPARERVLIAHPGNPPYLIPVVEIVPSRWTSDETVERAMAIFREAGSRPVLVRTEVEGFVFNRLQSALLREAYRLVTAGVVDVEGVDEIVRSGLGRRWAVIGPFETADLNFRGGIAAHAAALGPAYARIAAEHGEPDPFTPEAVAQVVAQRREVLPLDDWDERVRWRDAQLMRVKALLDGGATA